LCKIENSLPSRPMPPKAAKTAALDPLAASQADQEVEELKADTLVSTAPAAKSAARGAPLLAPFRGFSDDKTTDEFLYLFELSADGLDEKTTKTDLVRCLAPDLILSLLKAGFNMKSKSSKEIVEQLKKSFSTTTPSASSKSATRFSEAQAWPRGSSFCHRDDRAGS
jgi:hypothetical protein